jgi:NitT/TauT family transport system permease protein
VANVQGLTLPARRMRIALPLPAMLAALLFIALWQLLSMYLGHDALADPLSALLRLGDILSGARYRADLMATIQGFSMALALSWILGLGGAAWFGMRQLAGDVAEPMLVSFYAIPKVTLYPIVLLICGLGLSAKVTFGVMHGIVPVVLIGMAAIRNLKPVYLRTARSMGLSRSDTFFHVLLPAILPQFMTGMRIGFSMTLLGTQIGEMFGGGKGLGYMLIRAINLADTDTIMAIALLLLVFALVANWLLGYATQRMAGN